MRYNILGGNLCHYYYLFFKCQLSNWKRFSGKKKKQKTQNILLRISHAQFWNYNDHPEGIGDEIQT